MRKLFYLVCALAALAGCQKDGDEAPVSRSVIVNGVAGIFVGPTQDDDIAMTWTAGDAVGLYSPQALTSAGQAVANMNFRAGGAGVITKFDAASSDLDVTPGEKNYNFYAYAPYDPAAGNDHTAIPFSLGDQVQSAADNADHVNDNILLWASTAVDDPDFGSAVNFNFRHAYSLLRIDIKTGPQYVNRLVLTADEDSPDLTCSAGTLDLGDGSITVIDGSKQVALDVMTPLEPSTETQSCYMLILPGDHSGTDLMMTLNTLDGPVNKRLNGMRFDPGKIAVLDPDKVEIADYYSIDLSGFEFSDSFIYFAMNGDDTLAMVTSEYMGVMVDAQGILVYPWSDGSYLDNEIFVPKVTLVAAGSGADEDYLPPMGNVHGGTIAYNSSNNTYSYAAGKSPVFNTVLVRVDADNNVSIVKEGKKAAPLTLIPFTVEIDSYQYKVVKVGGQIWMAENLRTTITNTGEPLPRDGDWSSFAKPNYVWNKTDPSSIHHCMLYNPMALGAEGTGGNDVDDKVPYKDHVSPEGWHIASGHKLGDSNTNDPESDYGKMLVFVGESGERIKIGDESIGTLGNNVTNFSLASSGRRVGSSADDDFKAPDEDDILLWTGTNAAEKKAYILKVFRNSVAKPRCYASTNKSIGFATRLIMDPR